MTPRAVIFDFDGTIADTESADCQTWCNLLRPYGCSIPLALWASFVGTTDPGWHPLDHLESFLGAPVDRSKLRSNHRPMALVAGATLGNATTDTTTAHHLASASLIGLDIGPNLTTIGSLSTKLWLLILRQRGLHISSLEYMKVGAILTAPVLFVSVFGFWIFHS